MTDQVNAMERDTRSAGSQGQALAENEKVDGALEWFAAIGTIIAAGLVAADLGRRWTGWGFVLFVAVSISWIVSGILNGTASITIQNGALLLVNAWGVWRYLLNPEPSNKGPKKG
ncbi:hypothetical protein [Novosphingobium aromaticivorans]|nr:hypothetical protein [Novosphingobium aromaticivorans]